MRKLVYLLEIEETDKLIFPNVPDDFSTKILLPSASHNEIRREIADAEIIFGEPTLEDLSCCKKLRWVQMFWAGADRYLNGSFPANVRLTTASGAFGETIAEHALGMLFSLCRRLPAYAMAGKWEDLGCEKRISGQTAIVFGCGDIGSAIAKQLKALGVHTVGVCRNARTPRAGFDCLTTLNCAEVFLADADFVICAMPANQETTNYLNRERLSLLRDDSVLINVGRGSFIDTEALTERLSRGEFFGVGLDVVSPEPLPENHPLWTMPNVILTPHVAGVSFGHLPETEQKIFAICQENLQRYVSDQPLMNEVIL